MSELLAAATVELDEATFAAARRLAYRAGRVLERDGLALVGLGTAATLALPGGLADPADFAAVRRRLAALEPVGTPGPELPPLALGALPFDRHRSASLVVAELTAVATGSGPPAAVVVGPRGRVEALARGLGAGGSAALEAVAELAASSSLSEGEGEGEGESAPPDRFELVSARPHEDFCRRVAEAVAEVRSGAVDKVVLAREVTVAANRPLRQGDLVDRLRALHPSCLAFAVDGFIGATPELLVRRVGALVASHPLAGTAARSGDPASDERIEASLLASTKERSEHRAVVDTIAAALRGVTTELEVPEGPSILQLRNVSHLATSITGRLGAVDGQYPSALDLVGRLHPTPAVAGTPVAAAVELLAKLEDLDRDRYAGPVGWMDARGDGEWHLGLRCALVQGSSARLFAGVGIVADSDPAAELAETQLKLQAFLAAAVRP